MAQPKVEKKLNFQVFMEGIQIPFSNITISEAENALPSATIMFPSSHGALRILPSTVVQIFGPVKTDINTEETVLLFEGEVTGVRYNKGPAGRTAAVICNSLLASFYKATIRPQDVLITDKLRKQLGTRDIPTSISAKLTNNSGLSSSITNEFMDTWQSVSKSVITDDLENLTVTSKKNVVFDFIRLMRIPYIRSGDFMPIPQFFLRYFEVFDPYFGVQSMSYGLTRSIFAFPNPAKLTPFLYKVAVDNMKHIFSLDYKSDLALVEVLSQFQGIVGYDMIAPAAPTGSKIFWGTSGDLEHEVPMRSYYTPNLVNSPPAKFNVIFPNQIMSFGYERDMASETTRVVGELGIPFNSTTALPKGSSRTHVVPNIDYSFDEKDKLLGSLTLEESYRGITPGYEVMDPWLAKSLYTEKNSVLRQFEKLQESKRPKNATESKEWEDNIKADNEDYTKGFETSFEQMVTKAYMNGKYGRRISNIVCEWSPFRVVGVPGLILDEEGPSIFGVISSINTTIDANGSVNSTISLRSPRLIFDNEMGGVFQGEGDQTSIDNYLINDFTNDGALSINNFLFDEYYYDFLEIGRSVYTYLGAGTDNKQRKPFYNASLDSGIYDRYKSTLASNSWTYSSGDWSILDNIRSKETFAFTDEATEFATDSPTEEIRNAKYLYYSANKLRATYVNKKSSGSTELDNFITQFTKRNLISKTDYFKYIGINDVAPVKSEHYKDSAAIFTSPSAVKDFKNEYEKIRSIDKFIEEDSKEYPDIDTANAGPQVDYTLFREQIDKMADYNSHLASWIRIGKYQTVKQLGGPIIQIDADIPPIDVSSFGTREIYQRASSNAAFYEDTYKGYDSYVVYYNRYQTDVTRAEEEWVLRNKIIDFARHDYSARIIGDTTTENKTLDSKIFVPYNLIRYAHVKRAFQDFIRRESLTVIKN